MVDTYTLSAIGANPCKRRQSDLKPSPCQRLWLLPDAELAEDQVEQVFGGRLADDFADGVDGDAQVQRDQFQGLIRPQGFQRAQRGGAGAVERVLVARVDHHLQHLGLDFARPYQLLDGIFERLDPLPCQAAYVHDRRLEAGRELEPGRQVNLVADEDALLARELGKILLVGCRQRLGGVEHVQDELGLLQASPGCGGRLRVRSRRPPRAGRRCQ